MDESLKDTYLCIESKNKLARDINVFLNHFNRVLGAQTNLNYNFLPVENNVLRIPVHRYTNEDAAMKPQDLIDAKLNNLIKFCENLNIKKLSKEMLYLFRCIMNKYNINALFTVRVITTLEYENKNITLNFGNLKRIPTYSVKKVKFEDGSSILFYVDELLNDNGMFLNLSIPFCEMGYAYNALHLYEHLMTKGWDDVEFKQISSYNGATYPNGLSFIYTIFNKVDDLKTTTNKTLDFVIRSRKKGFWKSEKMRENIQFETVRTISEAINDRTLSSFGRSDPSAYSGDLDKIINIFRYWSNKPFNMLISTNDTNFLDDYSKMKSIVDSFSKRFPLEEVIEPEEVKIDFLPLDVLKIKNQLKSRVDKANPRDIYKIIMGKSNEDEKGLIGIDNLYISDEEDLSVYNSILHPMLFLNYNEEDIMKLLKTNPFPMNCNDVL